MNVVIALSLIALGMGLDAFYQRKIRIAECNAYETGYQQGKKEERFPLISCTQGEPEPSMAAPVEMPPTFEERLKKHGQATMWMKKGGKRYEFGCKEHY